MAAPFVPAPGPGLRGDGDALVSWAERTAHGDRRAPGRGMLRFVFYGRVSTEDWQDPVTSRARQREQAEALVRGHGVIVAELFDVGESRTVAWARRPQAAALVTALADPDRGWDAVVIGEYERAFYGSQYAAMAPLFEHYGVQLWMPETGGRVDYASEHDEKTMTVLGLSSKREITRTSIRVRTAMAAQTREQGRYLGGRPPYGYRLADAGPHPNKAHAAWGRRAHRLDPDPRTAPVVRWIFTQRLAGHSVARIARALNEAGVPCPSAADPGRNTHRTGAGWALGTVTTILENDVSRFPSRDNFAAYNGTAPIEVSSGNRKIYRLSRRGNRRLNHAVHMAAVTQIRYRHSDGRACYDRKLAEGKTPEEALRCLKRRVSDAIDARLQADARRAAAFARTAGPGGQPGNDSVASAAGSHPENQLFGQATPEPATTLRPPARPAPTRQQFELRDEAASWLCARFGGQEPERGNAGLALVLGRRVKQGQLLYQVAGRCSVRSDDSEQGTAHLELFLGGRL